MSAKNPVDFRWLAKVFTGAVAQRMDDGRAGTNLRRDDRKVNTEAGLQLVLRHHRRLPDCRLYRRRESE